MWGISGDRRACWRESIVYLKKLCAYDLLPNIVRVVKSRRMRWVGHVARMGKERGVHRILVRKPEGKRPLGRLRRRWEDNIKMDLQEVGGGCGNWMELAQDRDRWRALVSTVINFRIPKMWGISWLAAEPVSFSRRTLLHGVSKCVFNNFVDKTRLIGVSLVNKKVDK